MIGKQIQDLNIAPLKQILLNGFGKQLNHTLKKEEPAFFNLLLEAVEYLYKDLKHYKARLELLDLGYLHSI